jgi:hypothetical protein
MKVMSRGPRSRAGLIANPTDELLRFTVERISLKDNVPVCIPNDTAIPRMAKNTINGTRPFGGAEFLLSVTANTTINRTKVPINLAQLVRKPITPNDALTSSKKQFAEGM